jgi:hypothetical protein
MGCADVEFCNWAFQVFAAIVAMKMKRHLDMELVSVEATRNFG